MTDQLTPQIYHSQNSLLAVATNWNKYLEVGRSLLRSGFAPSHFKTPESIIAAILHGQEVGLTPMQALSGIFVINGKSTLDVATMKAIVTAHGVDIQIIESTSEKAHLKLVRGNSSEEGIYTFEEAKKAGLTSKDVWQKFPKDMLYARCAGRLMKNKCSDLLKGLYPREEMMDTINVTPTPEYDAPDKPLRVEADDNDLGSYRLTTKFSLGGHSLSECFCDEAKWKVLGEIVVDEAKFSRLTHEDQVAIFKFAPNLLEVTHEKEIKND